MWDELINQTIVPEARSITYLALGITSEAGEVASEAKKIIRKDNNLITIQRRSSLIAEIGDVLWYAHAMLEFLQASEYDAFIATQFKLLNRVTDGTIRDR